MGKAEMMPGKDYIGVGCGAVILNEKNQVLLMKRSKECRNQVGCWSIQGGGINFNETLEEGLKREVKEELSVDVEIVKSLGFCNDIMTKEKQHWITHLFLCKIIGGKIKNLEPNKCEDIRWFDLDKVPEKLTNGTLHALRNLKV